MLEERAAWLGERIAAAPIPVIAVGHTCVDVSDYGREVLGRGGIHLLGGIDLGMTALGHALRWLERQDGPWRAAACRTPRPREPRSAARERPARDRPGPGTGGGRAAAGAPWPETGRARPARPAPAFPVVPAELASSADEAVAAARAARAARWC